MPEKSTPDQAANSYVVREEECDYAERIEGVEGSVGTWREIIYQYGSPQRSLPTTETFDAIDASLEYRQESWMFIRRGTRGLADGPRYSSTLPPLNQISVQGQEIGGFLKSQSNYYEELTDIDQ